MSRRKQRHANAEWNGDDWRMRCAWCRRKIGEHEEVFGIGARAHPELLQETTPGTIQPMYLGLIGRVVPVMIAGEDSEAARSGKGLMFQLCSEGCAEDLQSALRLELDAASGKRPPA